MYKRCFFIIFVLLLVLVVSSCGPETGNQLPIITSDPVNWATVNQSYGYDVNATDPDGDNISFSLIEGPSGMTIYYVTGLIEWLPADAGNFDVMVQVTDTGNPPKSITQSFTIKVSAVQSPIADFDVDVYSGVAPLNVSFDASNSYDPDGYITSIIGILKMGQRAVMIQ